MNCKMNLQWERAASNENPAVKVVVPERRSAARTCWRVQFYCSSECAGLFLFGIVPRLTMC